MPASQVFYQHGGSLGAVRGKHTWFESVRCAAIVGLKRSWNISQTTCEAGSRGAVPISGRASIDKVGFAECACRDEKAGA
jgi:hypothetical protein